MIPDGDAPAPSRGDRRKLLVASGLGGSALGLALLFGVLRPPEAVELRAPAAPRSEPQPVEASAPAAAPPSPEPEPAPPLTIGRDPFTQLVTVPEAAVDAVPAASQEPAAESPTPASDAVPAPEAAAPAATPAAAEPVPEPDVAAEPAVAAEPEPPAPAPAPDPAEVPAPPPGLESLQLNFLFTDRSERDRAVLTFEGRLYDAGEGDVVAERFLLEQIDRRSGCIEVTEQLARVRICLPSWFVGAGAPGPTSPSPGR